ncbi:MAG: cyclodeaminase/cyclohydrolase family protein [Candidatus Omnitrophota bacterium]
MYYNKPLKSYLDDLAARLPAPGGGSASALGAALGFALISMVINFTLGKPKYIRYEPELTKLLSISEKMRKRLLELVDLDIAAYQSKDINKALSVPLEVSRLCFEAIKLCPPLVKKGNVNLISDVAVAVILIEAGFSGALFNVLINLKILKDKKRADRIIKEMNRKKSSLRRIRRNLEVKIDEVIGR